MFVSRSMTRKVITVDSETPVIEAQELMADNSQSTKFRRHYVCKQIHDPQGHHC